MNVTLSMTDFTLAGVGSKPGFRGESPTANYLTTNKTTENKWDQ